MASRAFDPQRPLQRPVRGPERLRIGAVWGAAELERWLAVARRGGPATLPGGTALAADALGGAVADEALDWLRAAGQAALVVDFDSLGGPADSRALQLAGLVKRLRRRGFVVHGRFTLGRDHDDVGCFERLVGWVEAAGVACVELRLWTPDPGSAEVRTLARQDRVRHQHLDRWDGAHVVIVPAQMSAETLYRGWAWAQRRLASLGSRWRRRAGAFAWLDRELGTPRLRRGSGRAAGVGCTAAGMVASYGR